MTSSLAAPAASDRERAGTAAFVLSLRARGVSDTAVLRALETVPREHFVPHRFADLARADVALPLPCGQTMTSPGNVAVMLAALDVRAGQRILEIGAGSGYVTALLRTLGGRVRSFERRAILYEAAIARLASGGFGDGIEVVPADGLAGDDGPDDGAPAHADRILLNGVTSTIPPALLDRLAPGGRLVGAVRQGGRPRLLIVERDPDGRCEPVLGVPLRLSPLM